MHTAIKCSNYMAYELTIPIKAAPCECTSSEQLLSRKMLLLYFLSILGIFTAASALRIPEERIVNGKAIHILEAPYHVALLVKSQFNCGGAILSRRIIITAAHCLQGKLPRDLSIVAGSTYWSKGGQRIDVRNFKFYEGFEYGGPYDVGVLLLAETLELNSKVQSIGIANKSPKAGDIAFVSGWGSISYSSVLKSEDLQGLEMEIIEVSDTIIATNAVTGVYAGDSGSPLVVDGELVGLVSGGDYHQPSIYTNLVPLSRWIKNAVLLLKSGNVTAR